MAWGVRRELGHSLGPWRRDMDSRIAKAAARTADKMAFRVRDSIRAAMRAQRLGNLANAIGATSDLRKKRAGLGGNLDVAGFVFARITSSRTAGALQAYVDQDSTNISPVNGKYMWIATSEIPRRAGRRRMTPALYISSGLESRIGPLKFVKGKHPGEAFYVVEDATIHLERFGKARRTPRSGRASAGRARVGIVAFVGIRRTSRSRRVDPRSIAAAETRGMAQLFAEELNT